METNELVQMNQPTAPAMMAPSAGLEMLSAIEGQEMKMRAYLAHQFPRDENKAMALISKECQRRSLADFAVYTYPKGGQNVTGPSIRLAEALYQSWGHLQCGADELVRVNGESHCRAYCWDLESNVRDEKVFIVPHAIQTKKGLKVLTDPRDISEHVANQMARRKRACILAVIPKYVVDFALDACQKTLASGNKRPLIDRLREMTGLFEKTFSVPLSSIEKYFGYPLDAFTEMDGVTLAGIYNALKEGAAKREDYFQLPALRKEPEPDISEKPDKPETVKLSDL